MSRPYRNQRPGRPLENRLMPLRYLVFRTGALGHIKEAILLGSAYFIYMFARKFVIADIENVALDNSVKVISFESASGFLWEPSWQSWAIENSKALVLFFNWAYIITYWPIIVTVALILYIGHRQKYSYYRNVWLLSFVFALTIFVLFPLAPPRFLPEYGFVDAIQRFGPSMYGGRDMAVFYNAYAAMPSLHFGWTALFGVLFFRAGPLWLKGLGVIYPTMTFFAITVTGNHYIIDAAAGVMIMLASFLAYMGFRRLKPRGSLAMASARARLGIAGAHFRTAVSSGTASARVAIALKRCQLRHEGFPSWTGKMARPIRISPARERRP